MSKKDKPLFTRGYSELTDTLKKKAKWIRHCNNCHFYYKDKGDTEELCQNESVLSYDVVIEGTTIFCHYWKPCEEVKETKSKEETNDYLARFKKGLKKR